MIDILLQGGEIDGTGVPRHVANVAVSEGRIVELGRLAGVKTAKMGAYDQ